MTTPGESIHGSWSNRLVFIFAATGSAVGLGNIWKFPYITGEYGGGLFVLIYLVCVSAIGIPIMMAEVMLGRMGRHSPINSMRLIAEQNGRTRRWQWLGWIGVVAGFLILSFYSVIAGWTLAYVFRVGGGLFDGLTADGVGTKFGEFVGDPEKLLFWHTLFMVMTFTVVARGVRHGLEKAVKYLMPMLFILLLIMLGYSISTGHFQDGMTFLFYPNLENIGNVKDFALVILVALGQAFFSLSLGMGAIMAYGAYLPKNTSIASTTLTIVILDTLVALIAGMVIFPIVFANGLEPSAGPGLIFQTLPLAFGHMQWGTFFGTLFFILLVFAGWTSAISLLEPAVAYLVERWTWTRMKAALVTSIIVWLLGLATVFSFNIWSEFEPLSAFEAFEGKTIFDLLDFLTANIMLPLGGLAIAIFAGWILGWKTTEDELAMSKEFCGYALWRMLVRYVSPVLVLAVFIYSLLKALGQLPEAP
ncbi:MAG: sodium-dependent transporter [Gammaproteobacteria bacterium]|nr:MAG: sodium-dependent transporter [Gammaproteobacteria bacterium]